jgi:fatty acid amide hydrolase
MPLDETRTIDITRRGAAELARLIVAGEVSAVEVVTAHLDRIDQVDPKLGAVAASLVEQARADAQAADAARLRGEPLGPLHGVPVSIKECFHVAGTDTTLGVDAFVGQPARADGVLVRRLKQAGAIVVAKTNVPQLMAMHESDNPVFGRTNNPWDLERSAGGSSGGEAALIAAGGSALGLGTDLGGSVRQPAHSCGIAALKPTTGRISMNGSRNNFAGMQSLRIQSGPMARRVEDLMLGMHALLPSASEPAELDEPPVPWREPAGVSIEGLRIAVWDDDGSYRPSPAIRRAVSEAAAALSDRGAVLEAFAPPDMDELMHIYYRLMSADGGACFRRMLEGSRVDWRLSRTLRLGSMSAWLRKFFVWKLRATGQARSAEIVASAGSLSADQYRQVVVQMESYILRFTSALAAERIDAMLFPPHALPALRHGTSINLLPAASYCFLMNLLGFPAGVVVATRVRAGEEGDRPESSDLVDRTARKVESGSEGLPVGVQVAAAPWREDIVLAVMQALEEHFSGQADYPAAPPL